MNILGLGGSDHSFSACLISDDKIVCAIEEERISREKYSLGPNSIYGKCKQYCLNELGIDLEDVDLVVGNDLLHPMFYHSLRKKIKLINHHLAHAYSGFYTLPLTKCAVLVIDGTGSRYGELAETVTYGKYAYNNFTVLDKVFGKAWKKTATTETLTENSIGDFYRRFTEGIGFRYLQDGKTMGLAPFGTDRYYEEMKKFVKFTGDGKLEIKINDSSVDDFLAQAFASASNEEEKFQVQKDIAWGAQAVTEDCVLYCCEYLYEKTKMNDLCIVGGVGLNSVANSKVRKYSKFENVYVPPYSSDTGTALGAAFYGHSFISNKKIQVPNLDYNVFSGHIYSEQEILEALQAYGEDVITYERKTNICQYTAQQLAEGKIIGWFHGGSEIGPRALGHRSILADARIASMQDTINYDIKHREGFRPFAPSVLKEYAKEYFELDFDAPYMLFVVDVKEDKKNVIPAIVHVDGTARVQTVDKESNPKYYELISEFHHITGVPVLLNTSFNVIPGEPIVETPADAIHSFISSDLNLLIMEDYVVRKVNGEK